MSRRRHRNRKRQRPLAPAALCAARIARRVARLLRVHRLHRARQHGDRRRRLAGGEPRRRAGAARPGHPRRRSVLHADPARGHTGRTRLPAQPRQGVERRHLARHGAHRRRQGDAGRDEGGRRRLSAVRHGSCSIRPDRSPHALAAARRRLRRGRRPDADGAARHQTGRAAHRRQRHVRNPRRARERAGQARRRHRLRAAPDGERGGAARHRPAAAGQPGALALSPAAAGERHQRRRRQGGDRAGARAISRRPAGRSAAAAMPRRSSSAMSSASRNSSPSSA